MCVRDSHGYAGQVLDDPTKLVSVILKVLVLGREGDETLTFPGPASRQETDLLLQELDYLSRCGGVVDCRTFCKQGRRVGGRERERGREREGGRGEGERGRERERGRGEEESQTSVVCTYKVHAGQSSWVHVTYAYFLSYSRYKSSMYVFNCAMKRSNWGSMLEDCCLP